MQFFLETTPRIKRCFNGIIPNYKVRVWGIHEVTNAPLPGDVIIFANYSSDIERHRYHYWQIRFMGIVRYTKICPDLAEILFGTDYWKTMMLLSEVKRPPSIVHNAILDFLRVHIEPEPVNRWRLSDPIPFKEFNEYLAKYGKTRQDKKQLNEFSEYITQQIQSNLKYRNESWLGILIWRDPII